ncbi:MAG: hypothetical protein CVV31_11630 [Methanomicrobiales archaeon HGW-Methanomicrobiales-2]|jgi:hypothetical protein|nr:MAG: hypothetical protein CVV31_11630 [Methanomicrobiales archaeon HGW-Methanomicrobiales-2]
MYILRSPGDTGAVPCRIISRAFVGTIGGVSGNGVPGEEVVGKAGPTLAERDPAENIRKVKQEMARRVERGMAAVPAW